jgi:hypothetical protein
VLQVVLPIAAPVLVYLVLVYVRAVSGAFAKVYGTGDLVLLAGLILLSAWADTEESGITNGWITTLSTCLFIFGLLLIMGYGLLRWEPAIAAPVQEAQTVDAGTQRNDPQTIIGYASLVCCGVAFIGGLAVHLIKMAMEPDGTK